MPKHAPVSVVVASRERPDHLYRCLTGLGQLFYHPFEVVIVADEAGRARVSQHPLASRIKLVLFDEANISRARNLGIEHSAGEVIAFIDDDAVPEPTWLDHLIAPFSDNSVAVAGGYVLGRNGISLQCRANSVDAQGYSHPVTLVGDDSVVRPPAADGAIKTEGTNCAVRRSALLELGGFDPAFRFYHDDTDLDMRIAARGWATAIVPLARVHHKVAPSRQRQASRMPKTLFEIGRSSSIFLRKHSREGVTSTARSNARRVQRARLLRHMIAGNCEPRDVRRLLDDFCAGFEDGCAANLVEPWISADHTPFIPLNSRQKPRKSVVLSGRPWNRARLRSQAIAQVEQGNVVTVFRFSPTALYHHVRFRSAGYWEQTGGLYGRSERSMRLVRLLTFRQRVAEESARIAGVRLNLDT